MSREALSLDISRLVARVVAGEPIDTAERGAALAAKYPDLGMSGVLIGQAIDRAVGMVGMIRSAPRPAKRSKESVEHSQVVTSAAPPLVNAHTGIASQLQTNGHLAEPAEAMLLKTEAETEVSVPLETPEASGAPSPTSNIAPIDDDVTAGINAGIGGLVSGTVYHAMPATCAGDKSVEERDLTREQSSSEEPGGFEDAVTVSNGRMFSRQHDVTAEEALAEQADDPVEITCSPAKSSPKGPIANLRRVFFGN